jgi:hypothetical protein
MSGTITELHIFSDACGGQNCNNTCSISACIGVTCHFHAIHQYFPVRGHSFLQCDGNFVTAKRKIRKIDRIYTPEDYNELIQTAREVGYSVTKVTSEHTELVNYFYRNWWPKFLKQQRRALTNLCSLLSLRYWHLQYSSATKGSEYIDGVIKTTFLLQKPNLLDKITLSTENAYTWKIPINERKLQEVKKVNYMPTEKRDIFESTFIWPKKK